MAVAAFDFAAWSARYPELGAVGSTLAASFFSEATLYLDNTDASPVTDAGQRLVLLNMLTAHIAALAGFGGRDPGMVGRVSSASEGSVSISADAGALPGSAAWYQQTSYGMSYWQATKPFRSAVYVPAPAYNFNTRALPWQR